MLASPEGSSTQYLRSLAPRTIKGIVFGTRVPQYWVLGPFGKLSRARNMQVLLLTFCCQGLWDFVGVAGI